MRGSEWTVVGVFEAGDANDSEMWADLGAAQSAFGRGNSVSGVRVGLESPEAIETLRTALASDPRLSTEVLQEREYYNSQTEQFRAMVTVLAGVVTLIMALGAIFAALNTMYAAVATRTREIATLRAIGFGGFPVLVSVMVEAVVLALIGGLLGAFVAWALFDNLSVSTLGQAFTQVVFAFQVSLDLVAIGLVIAVVIGFVGGLLPAVRAARVPVTTALRPPYAGCPVRRGVCRRIRASHRCNLHTVLRRIIACPPEPSRDPQPYRHRSPGPGRGHRRLCALGRVPVVLVPAAAGAGAGGHRPPHHLVRRVRRRLAV